MPTTDQEHDEIIGSRPLNRVRIVAPTDAAILIQGETGTVKDMIARAIHEQSARRSAPLVKVDCTAIPGPLLESELFGHERGAFTGACTQTQGLFQAAERGTLFLDEVGDLPLELQPKLLRAVQDHEFARLGNCRKVRVNVRVVAATNRDLEKLVKYKRLGLPRSSLVYKMRRLGIDRSAGFRSRAGSRKKNSCRAARGVNEGAVITRCA